MPKIKLKRAMLIRGKHRDLAEVVEVTKDEARFLVDSGSATTDIKDDVPGEKEAKAKKAEEAKAKK